MLSRYCIHLICSREFTIRSQTLYRSKRILKDRGAELMSVGFRRRINTEEKPAKVIAAVRGTEFLASLYRASYFA